MVEMMDITMQPTLHLLRDSLQASWHLRLCFMVHAYIHAKLFV